MTLFSATSNAAPQVTRALVAALAANQALDLADLADLADLFAPGPPDPQLGAGLLPYRDPAGRPERRIRGQAGLPHFFSAMPQKVRKIEATGRPCAGRAMSAGKAVFSQSKVKSPST